MKLKSFLFILLFVIQSLQSKDLHYTKYIEILLSQNLSLQIQKKEQEKVEQWIKKKESLFQDPIKFNLEYSKGNIKTPLNILKSEEPSKQILNQYTIGISKFIDVLNQQKTQREIYSIQRDIEGEYQEWIKKQNLIQFRKAYFDLIFLNLIKEHLQEHVVKFNRLKMTVGKSYFDKKLGYYTIPALELGINTLKTELSEINSMINHQKNILYNLLSNSEFVIELDRLEEIENLFPEKVHLEDLLNPEESPIIKIENLKTKILVNNIELYKKLPYETTEIFFNYTKKSRGDFRSPTFESISPEEEVLWSFGVRVPIPYGSEKQYDVSIQKKELEIQQIKTKQLKIEIRNEIKKAHEDYLNHYSQYKRNLKLLKEMEPYLEMLEDSLIKRRITYFEFWGEHEKYHNLLVMTMHSFQQIVESLSILEIYSGKKLFLD